jgi:iron complex transport system substrate-binding protein
MGVGAVERTAGRPTGPVGGRSRLEKTMNRDEDSLKPPSKYVSRILAVVLTAVALVGCGASNDRAGSTPAPSAAPAATRTVVDMTGRSVQIPAKINRIGTNYPALNQTIFMLGAADRVVATTKDMRTSYPLFTTMYPRLKDISAPFTSASSNANVEELLADRPDIVFLSAGSEGLLPTLQRLNIPTLVFSSFKDPEALKAGVQLVAKVLGGDTVDRANRFTAYYDGNVKRVQTATAGIPPADQPKVYYTAGNPLQTEGKGSIVTTWMNAAGGRNIAAENGISTPPTFSTVSFEDVAKWNPDVIICREPATKKAIMADPRWSNVAAVKNNRVVVSPRGVFIWSVRSAEAALQPLWAAKMLNPDKVTDLDMRKEVKDFYAQFYSYNLSDQQIDGILNPT